MAQGSQLPDDHRVGGWMMSPARVHTGRCNHEESEEQDERAGLLGDVIAETKRCAGIVKNLLAFSRVGEAHGSAAVEVAPGQILGRVLRLLEYRVGKERVTLETSVADGLPMYPSTCAASSSFG